MREWTLWGGGIDPVFGNGLFYYGQTGGLFMKGGGDTKDVGGGILALKNWLLKGVPSSGALLCRKGSGKVEVGNLCKRNAPHSPRMLFLGGGIHLCARLKISNVYSLAQDTRIGIILGGIRYENEPGRNCKFFYLNWKLQRTIYENIAKWFVGVKNSPGKAQSSTEWKKFLCLLGGYPHSEEIGSVVLRRGDNWGEEE